MNCTSIQTCNKMQKVFGFIWYFSFVELNYLLKYLSTWKDSTDKKIPLHHPHSVMQTLKLRLLIHFITQRAFNDAWRMLLLNAIYFALIQFCLKQCVVALAISNILWSKWGLLKDFQLVNKVACNGISCNSRRNFRPFAAFIFCC